MASKVLPAEEQTDAPAGGPPPELDTATLYRLVAERVRLVSPGGMANLRLVWDIPGNSVPGSLPLIVPDPELSDTAAEILRVLRDAEGWLNGKEIGGRLSPLNPVDHKQGSFRDAIDELKGHDLIETNKNKGYKVK